MGLNDWFTRRVTPIPRTYDLEDFPGHSYDLVECHGCGSTFTGIFKTTYPEVTCPKCKTPGGVELVKVLRRIYLH